MIQQLKDMFSDPVITEKIKIKLPILFHMANLESMRAGKIGMEVGTIRERILSSLLIYHFGKQNVETEIPTTQAEIDVKLYNRPISIKTISSTGNSFAGVKLSWTVDAAKANAFASSYIPQYDMLFAQIKWDDYGALYYISSEVQQLVFSSMVKGTYLKLPTPGTNPRGVEISGDALSTICKHPEIEKLEILWKKQEINIDMFERWVDLWAQD